MTKDLYISKFPFNSVNILSAVSMSFSGGPADDPVLQGPLQYWGKCYRTHNPGEEYTPVYELGCNMGHVKVGETQRVSDLPLEIPTGYPRTVQVKHYRPAAKDGKYGIAPGKGTRWAPATIKRPSYFDDRPELLDVMEPYLDRGAKALRLASKTFADATRDVLPRHATRTRAKHLADYFLDRYSHTPYVWDEEDAEQDPVDGELYRTTREYITNIDNHAPFEDYTEHASLVYFTFIHPWSNQAILVESIPISPPGYAKQQALREHRGQIDDAAELFNADPANKDAIVAAGWKYNEATRDFDKPHRVLYYNFDQIRSRGEAITATPTKTTHVMQSDMHALFLKMLTYDKYIYVQAPSAEVSLVQENAVTAYTMLCKDRDNTFTWRESLDYEEMHDHFDSLMYDEPATILYDLPDFTLSFPYSPVSLDMVEKSR